MSSRSQSPDPQAMDDVLDGLLAAGDKDLRASLNRVLDLNGGLADIIGGNPVAAPDKPLPPTLFRKPVAERPANLARESPATVAARIIRLIRLVDMLADWWLYSSQQRLSLRACRSALQVLHDGLNDGRLSWIGAKDLLDKAENSLDPVIDRHPRLAPLLFARLERQRRQQEEASALRDELRKVRAEVKRLFDEAHDRSLNFPRF